MRACVSVGVLFLVAVDEFMIARLKYLWIALASVTMLGISALAAVMLINDGIAVDFLKRDPEYLWLQSGILAVQIAGAFGLIMRSDWARRMLLWVMPGVILVAFVVGVLHGNVSIMVYLKLGWYGYFVVSCGNRAMAQFFQQP